MTSWPLDVRSALRANGFGVEVRAGLRDHPRPGSGWIDWRAPDARGNPVVLEHGDGLYSPMAHLRRGSVCVPESQHLRAGERLVECGHSGHSSEPHLHFQLQDRRSFYTAGLPMWLEGTRAAASEPAFLRMGDRLEPSPQGAWADVQREIEAVPAGVAECVWSVVIMAMSWVGVAAYYSQLLRWLWSAVRAAAG